MAGSGDKRAAGLMLPPPPPKKKKGKMAELVAEAAQDTQVLQEISDAR